MSIYVTRISLKVKTRFHLMVLT